MREYSELPMGTGAREDVNLNKEQRLLASQAIDRNCKDSTARKIIRYVMACELWNQDTISPTNKYLSKKYGWTLATTKTAIKRAKKSQFIATTGRGRTRCLELNVGFLEGKMLEILGRRPIRERNSLKKVFDQISEPTPRTTSLITSPTTPSITSPTTPHPYSNLRLVQGEKQDLFEGHEYEYEYKHPIVQGEESFLKPASLLRGKQTEQAKLSRGSSTFDFVLALYPRKDNAQGAKRAWISGKLDKHTSEIIAFVEKAKQSEQWKKEEGRYIPNLVNFLKDERWKDPVAEETLETRARRIRIEVETIGKNNGADAEELSFSARSKFKKELFGDCLPTNPNLKKIQNFESSEEYRRVKYILG